MANHFNLGKEVIVEASKAQLRMIDESDGVLYATGYGSSSSLFELALHRVGELDLARRFVDPHPNKQVLVERISAYNDLLTAIIVNLQRGNKGFAEELEKAQREEFYLENAGYVDPHFKLVMNPWAERKAELRQGLLERGIKGNERYMTLPEVRDYYERYGVIPPVRDGSYNARGNHIGQPSLQEGIYAVYANLALDDKAHAKKVINDIFNLYQKHGSQMFLAGGEVGTTHGSSYDNTATILRAAGLTGEFDAHTRFGELEKGLMKCFETELKSSQSRDIKHYVPSAIPHYVPLAFALDYFRKSKSLSRVRTVLAELPLEPTLNRGQSHSDTKVHFGWDSGHNAKICDVGLALIGLEVGKPTFFYVP